MNDFRPDILAFSSRLELRVVIHNEICCPWTTWNFPHLHGHLCTHSTHSTEERQTTQEIAFSVWGSSVCFYGTLTTVEFWGSTLLLNFHDPLF